MKNKKDDGYICINCHSIVKNKTEGGCAMAIAWLVIIFLSFGVGLILYFLASGKKKKVCSVCGAKNTLIPTNSPKAMEILKK